MKSTALKERHRITIFAAILLLAIGVTVLGCGWEVGSEHSVRFNSYHTERQLGQLPPLPKYERSKANKLFTWKDDHDESWEKGENETKRIDELWNTAEEDQADKKLDELRRTLRSYLERTEPQHTTRWSEPKDKQKRRNSAIDQLDALGELDHGASEDGVVAYLAARAKYDAGGQPDEVLKLLAEARHDARLRDNADYLEAALRQSDGHAIYDFEQLAHKYPHSEKREASLYMSALLTMKLSQSYKNEHRKGARECSNEDCRDPQWHLARAGFERVMREYPHGRYFADARGWLGYLSLLAGDKAAALVEYYRLLSESSESGKEEALFSLCLVRHKADDSEMDRVEKALEHEPPAALAYAYHDVYNYALRSNAQRWFYEDYYSFKDETASERTGRQRHEVERAALFAARMMNRFPSSAVGAAFVVRVAEADLELDKDVDASRLARRALVIGANADIRAEALWIAGVSEFRLHQYSTARQALAALIAENSNNRYTEGARRQLAMLEEDTGNIGAALDQYLALDYRYDAAYFVDVLMTPEQLAAFIEKRPALNRRDEMLYALGIRYLRDRRWSDARAAFARLKPLGRNVDESYLRKRYDYRDGQEELERAVLKDRGFDPSIRGIRQQWVEQDVRTSNELERLEREVEAAPIDETKAEALYQVASYQFERSLLFYNPLEWNSQRHYLLDDLDQRGAFRGPNESQMLLDYMQKHDMASSSLPIFLEVVRRFPNTRAAKDALFTAAVCHERLHEYNNYWREVYSGGGHAGPRMVTYRDVKAAYPGYKFPRGTFGWEPSTRTVNGGPGWDKPPRPAPRPSRWARVERLANYWSTENFKLINRMLTDIEFPVKQVWSSIVAAVNWVGHWLWIIAMCCWLWFLWRRAREAIILMSEVLAQCEPRPAEERLNPNSLLEVTPSASVLKRYLNQDIRAQWLEPVYDLEYKIRQIVHSKRGISITAFYVASHGLFAVLLLRLLVNL
jgi:outer membrane protein assembly factor BamD (BamD/ComL family)